MKSLIEEVFKFRDGASVNRIGYGAMQLTGPGVFGDVTDREKAKKVLQTAVLKGVNFIDTAEAYGPQFNESLIAEALHPYPPDLFIATKGGYYRPGPDQWIPKGDPLFIRENIEGSLRRLRVDAIDLWQLHRIDPHVPVDVTLEPVVRAMEAGKIKRFGLSEVDIHQLEQVRKILPVSSVQNRYNLADKRWEQMIDHTAKLDIAFIPWFPLGSGPEQLAQLLTNVASANNSSPARTALAWMLRRSPNIILIPGTSSIEHLLDNLSATLLDLSAGDFEKLNDYE